jgi:3',5'-cyclic AMP phosphodiesterase CpdA
MNNHLFLYCALAISIFHIVFPYFIRKRFVTPGEEQVYYQAFTAFPLSGLFAAPIVAYYSFVQPEGVFDFDSKLYLGLLLLAWPYITILFLSSGVLVRSIEIHEATVECPTDVSAFTRNNPALLFATHISDGHIPEAMTMEGGKPINEAIDRTTEALQAGVHYLTQLPQWFIFYTGDVTDTGSDAEWLAFSRACGATNVDLDRLFIVPGNHDLSLEARDSIPERGFERRCANFVRHVLKGRSTWAYLSGHTLKPIKTLFEGKGGEYMDIYARFPPVVRGYSYDHRTFVRVEPSEQMEEALSDISDDCDWPKANRALYSDVMKIVYPMIFAFSSRILILGLNSCPQGAEGVLDGAFGTIDHEQMSRLEDLLELAGSRRVVILIHHHVGVPSRIKAHFKNKGESLNLRYLQMTNAKTLLKMLRGRNVAIFHGHKHVGYQAKIDNVMVVSAPSITYGDIAGAVSPIAHYLFPTNGPSVVSIAGGLRLATKEQAE